MNWRYYFPWLEESIDDLKKNAKDRDIENKRRRENPLCNVADLIDECKK